MELSDKKTILAVDDTPENIDIISEVLRNDFNVIVALNGEDAQEILDDGVVPDVILLDVMMPGMDGFELCQKIRERWRASELPVIFISALDSQKDRLKGFDAGGNDYLIKPIVVDELRKKVELAVEHRALSTRLQQEADFVRSTAMAAMSTAGELGVVLEFLRHSFNAKTPQDLAQLVINTMLNYQLNCSVQIDMGDERIELGENGPLTPMEVGVIETLKAKGRIFDYHQRTVINYPNMSMLIKNMPLDEPERYGRIKDSAALIAEGADARVISMRIANELEGKELKLKKVIHNTSEVLGHITERHQEHKQGTREIMDELLGALEASFMSLGLTEPQEEHLLKISNEAIEKALSLYDQDAKTDQFMKTLQEELSAVTLR